MPSASASFSANCTGSFGVLMPTRSVVTSGFGNVPGAVDAVAAADVAGAVDGVAAPPHAAMTAEPTTSDRNVREKPLMRTTPPNDLTSGPGRKCNRRTDTSSTISPESDALDARQRDNDRVR